VHAVHALEKETWPAHVQVLDGGTGGFQLLDFFRTYSHIILLDATRDGAPAGTCAVSRRGLRRIFRRSARTTSPARPAFRGRLARPAAAIDVITVSVTDLVPMKLELSPAVAQPCRKSRGKCARSSVQISQIEKPRMTLITRMKIRSDCSLPWSDAPKIASTWLM